MDQSYCSDSGPGPMNVQDFAQLNATIDTAFARLEATMDRLFDQQLRWMFAGWVTIILAMIGLWARR
jgi:hypothetical protein